MRQPKNLHSVEKPTHHDRASLTARAHARIGLIAASALLLVVVALLYLCLTQRITSMEANILAIAVGALAAFLASYSRRR